MKKDYFKFINDLREIDKYVILFVFLFFYWFSFLSNHMDVMTSCLFFFLFFSTPVIFCSFICLIKRKNNKKNKNRDNYPYGKMVHRESDNN